MIKGIGIDFIDTDRFKGVKNNKKFLEQFLTHSEILHTPKNCRKTHYRALAFVIKEAIFKAFGVGLYYGSFWHDIEVNKTLRPRIFGFFKKFLKKKTKLYVTQSYLKRYALSFILIEE